MNYEIKHTTTGETLLADGILYHDMLIGGYIRVPIAYNERHRSSVVVEAIKDRCSKINNFLDGLKSKIEVKDLPV